jgi:hypothetical protein
VDMVFLILFPSFCMTSTLSMVKQPCTTQCGSIMLKFVKLYASVERT